MVKSRALLVCIVLLMALTVAAPSAAQDAPLQVVATTTIIADVAQNVGGELVDVSTIIPPGADVHSFQVTPRDVARIADADLVLVNGMFLEEGLLDTVETVADGEIVVVSVGVEILSFDGHSHDHDHEGDDHEHEGDDHKHEGDDHEHEGDDHEHEGDDHEREGDDHEHEGDDHEREGDDHEHMSEAAYIGVLGDGVTDCDLVEGEHMSDEHGDEDHDHEHGDHDHDHGPCDPHVWTDPANVMLWAQNIADAFAAADPAHAEVYAANAAAYIAELEALHAELVATLETIPVEGRVLVTNHGFLAYFAERYGFEVVGTVIPAATTAAEATPRSLVELVEIIEAEGVRAIFAEVSDQTDLAETIAAEVGEAVQVLSLYSGSLSDADGPAATYLDYMRYNVELIVSGLTG